MDARYLCADALEQLGYQAESGAWRNAYLAAAYELRNGTGSYPQVSSIGAGTTAQGMDAPDNVRLHGYHARYGKACRYILYHPA